MYEYFILEGVSYTKKDIENALEKLYSNPETNYKSTNNGTEFSILYKEKRFAIKLIYEQMRLTKNMAYNDRTTATKIREKFIDYYEILPSIKGIGEGKILEKLKKEFKKYLDEILGTYDSSYFSDPFYLLNKPQGRAKEVCREKNIFFWKIFDNEDTLNEYMGILKQMNLSGTANNIKRLKKFFDKNGGYINWLRSLESLEVSKVEFPTQQDKTMEQGENPMAETKNTKPALNQILYGPPGTGKTYNTVIEAMKIINKDVIKYDTDGKVTNYDEVKKEFDRLKNEEHRIEFVTFHQSYSYEEFVEGIKPYIPQDIWKKDKIEEKELPDIKYIGKKGVFKDICKRADFDELYNSFRKYVEQNEVLLKTSRDKKDFIVKNQTQSDGFVVIPQTGNNTSINITKEEIKNPSKMDNRYGYAEAILNNINKPYVLIIDEINRGNISKIFGELITLIEEDKRKNVTGDDKEYHTIEVKLPYSNEPFTVPNNLYIIGTMNTADKSLALLDVALRRRFEFVPMYPKREGFKNCDILNALNDEILKKKKNADYLIGHSYFMGDDSLENIFNHKVIPLLMEYFNGKVNEVQELLKDIISKHSLQFDDNYLMPEKSDEYYYLQVKENL